ncbi:MAG: spore maturation protein A [Clostridia bacterium]|nr:spore maturation protein A [Clostridia bacterium]
MNFVWTFAILVSLIFSAFLGFPEKTLQSGIFGADEAIKIMISLSGTLCFWSGVLRIAEKGGAADFCQKLLSPIIRRLFPKTNQRGKITMNIIANLFGTGNAATPAGISAMEGMDKENGKSSRPSCEMGRFAVMNTASIQLFPTTVISILSSLGAENPFSIVPYVWISSFSALFMALLTQKLLFGKDRL